MKGDINLKNIIEKSSKIGKLWVKNENCPELI